ncbi:DUF6646 family protein [Soonwooa sp.]|uniref:DUF6646 family protein n=1 Tax=Soonwooa sp. TaxID=1938592 RepID=UPI0028B0AF47|nr:DUF6646 family protein [Soonwooa sp.]
MKKLMLAALGCFMMTTASAQAWNGKGDQKVQAGLNFYGSEGLGLKGSYDYGIADAISVGAGLGLYFGKNDSKSDFSIHGRFNYHLHDLLNLDNNLDIYPGVTLGVLGDTFDFGAHVGVRYFFTDKIGGFVELGNRGGLGVVVNL